LISAGCWLAVGAEVGAPITNDYPLNRGATDRAEVAAKAMGNLKLKVGCPLFPARAKVGIGAGTLIADS